MAGSIIEEDVSLEFADSSPDEISFRFRDMASLPQTPPVLVRMRSSLRDTSTCLPRIRSYSSPQVKEAAEQSVRETMQLLNLDSSRRCGVVMSWVTGLVLIGLVPIFAYFCIEPNDNDPEHQLPFRLLVLWMQSSLAAVAFIFIHSNVRQHGLRGVLFLDVAAEETFQVQKEYDECLKHAKSLLLRVFLPAFILHLTQKIWLFWEVPLRLLPIDVPPAYRFFELGFIVILTSVSWVFETTTFLFVCVIFWKVCMLQELKMNSYRELVRKCLDPAFCFREYMRIINGLSIISRRFRLFLALTGGITIFGALASMYQTVLYRAGHLNFFNSGNVTVVNWVALMGAGLCLRSASKIAHLHRRIVKTAATMQGMHAMHLPMPATPSMPMPWPMPITMQIGGEATGMPASPTRGGERSREGGEGGEDALKTVHMLCQRQEAWSQRAALVNYLANTTAGISVYGFVLDRSFVHTTLGALLTTTWFILGRSLSGSLPTTVTFFRS